MLFEYSRQRRQWQTKLSVVSNWQSFGVWQSQGLAFFVLLRAALRKCVDDTCLGVTTNNQIINIHHRPHNLKQKKKKKRKNGTKQIQSRIIRVVLPR